MNDFEKRLQALSPEKRAEVLRRLEERQKKGERPVQTLPKAVYGDEAPLSSAQKQMWFLNRLTAGGGYHMLHFLSIEGEINSDALAVSVRGLMERHEVLRTVFHDNAGEPFQKILPEMAQEQWGVSIVPEGVDFRTYVVENFASHSFDLAHHPPIRIRLFKNGQGTNVLGLIAHHIALDEWGFSLVMQELEAGYLAALNGTSPPVIGVYQAADYALWESKRLASKEFEEGLQFWRGQLQNMPRAAFANDGKRRGAAIVREIRLSEEQTARVMSFARTANVGPNAVYMLALSKLVSVATKRDEFVVGVPVTARNRPEFQSVLGMMVNTAPVPLAHTQGSPPSEALERVAKVWRDALKWSWIPLDSIIGEVGGGSGAGLTPLFDLLFNFVPGGSKDDSFAGHKASVDQRDLPRTLYAILLTVVSGAAHRVSFAFDSHLFSPEASQAWASAFDRTLNAIIDQPSVEVTREYVLGEDAQLILREEKISAEAIRRMLEELLPTAAIPAQIVLLDELPRLPSGKVDRKALPRPDSLATREFVLPRNDTEQRVFSIWAEYLKTENLGVHESFFEVGGHSIIAVRVQHALSAAFDTDVPLDVLFSQPTIAGIADWLSSAGSGRTRINHQSYGDVVPVSFEQRRMWFLQKLDPTSVAYNISIVTQLDGDLNKAALELAVNELVDRHEVLRTFYPEHDGLPVQRIQPVGSVRVPWVESRAEDIDSARVWLEVVSNGAFDLETEAPIRVALVQLSDRCHVFLLLLHHIVIDEWSISIAVGELAELFSAHAAGRPAQLPEPRLQYADYALWQQEKKQSPSFDGGLEFWREHLANSPARIEWPLFWKGAARKESKTLGFKWTPETSRRFVEFTRGQDATLFTALHSALSAYIAVFTGQRKMTFGIPVNQRQQAELQSIVGMLLNTVPFATDVPVLGGFGAWMKTNHGRWTESMTHQWIPLEEVVKVSDAHQDAEIPLFDLLFSFVPGGDGGVSQSFGGLSAKDFEMGSRREPKLPIVFVMHEHAGVLSGGIELDLSKLPLEFGYRLASGLEDFVNRCLDRPNSPMVGHQEHRVRLSDPTGPLPDIGVVALFESAVKETPQACALDFLGGSWTYGELDLRANVLANSLRTMNVGRGDVVGIDMGRSPDMIAGILGILKAGAAYMPIGAGLPAARLDYMLSNGQCRIVVCDGDRAREYDERDVDTLSPQMWGTDDSSTPLNLVGEDLMCVLYTSGSTGRPKGVALRHETFVNAALWKHRTYPFQQDGAVLQKTPYVFDVASCEIFTALTAGARLVVPEDGIHRDPEAMTDWIMRGKVTHLEVVPSQLEMIISVCDGLDELPVEHVFSAGEVLTPSLVRRFQAAMPQTQIHNQYGPTETFYTTHWTCDETLRDATPIGIPVDNLKCFAADPWGNARESMETGELCVGGAGVARGYINQPRETALKFIPDSDLEGFGGRVYRTGDVVASVGAGEFAYVGRADRQVKLRGQRIELDEVERALEAHVAVARAAVITTGVNGRAENLIGYIEWLPGRESTTEEVLDVARNHVPPYMIPSLLVELDEMPQTATGKLDRQGLPKPGEARLFAEAVAPRNELESEIAGIWSQALGRDNISVLADFFSLGGHSLLAVQVRQRLSKVLDVEIPLAVLFTHTTVEELAAYVADRRSGTSLFSVEDQSLVHLRDGEDSVPTVFVHPIGGAVFSYRQLAAVWPGSSSIWGLQSRGLAFGDCVDDLSKMAQMYAQELISRLPGKSFVLGGWSFGGVLALELARVLGSLGVEVERVVLLDSYAPETGPDRDEEEEWRRFAFDLATTVGASTEDIASYSESVLSGSREERISHLAQAASRWSDGRLQLDEETLTRLYDVYDANYRAYRRHTPSHTPVPTHLIHATRVDPSDRGWSTFCSNLQVDVIEADHYQIMRGPWVSAIAAIAARNHA